MNDRFDAAHYEEIKGQVRGLLIELSNILDSEQLVTIDELIDANESGVALDLIIRLLLVKNAAIGIDIKGQLIVLVRDLELDQEISNRVESLPVQ